MTLVQFFVNFLRPYANMPEFTFCVMTAMKELGRSTNNKSLHGDAKKICQLAGKDVHTTTVDNPCNE